MTEKNTLSILENIKKKMQKFDQEPKKIETVSSVDDEFEYISSSKPKAVEVKVEPVVSAAEIAAQKEAAEIEQSFQEAPKPMESAVQEVAKPEVQEDNSSFDDLGLDDLSDLDSGEEKHETVAAAVKTSPAVEQPLVNQTQVSENKIEEDFDLDLDLNDDMAQPSVNQTQVSENKIEEDFDLDDAVEEPKPAQTQELKDDFNYDANAELAKKKIEEEAKSDQDFDDLDLDALLKEQEEEVPSIQKNQEPEVAPVKSTQEIDEDEFLKDLENEEVAEEAKTPQKAESKSIADELFDDIDLDDLDDIENEMSPVGAPAQVQNIQVEEVKLEEPIVEEEVAVEEPIQEEILEEEPVQEEVLLEEPAQSLSEEIHEEEFLEEVAAPMPVQEPRPVTINSDLENLLQNQNFAEIAVHIMEPKLEAWLDEHLHGLVEKIVQEEVKKLFDKR